MEGEYDAEKGTWRLWMNEKNIYEYFKKKGFVFPADVITRYFLSLRTKPFVILTGISGTGKTKLAQIFADYVCQGDAGEERRKRIAFVSVRPDWMDNKGLLGYYNLLDEKYHTSPVLDLLFEAGRNPDKPYFVILEEMNLAKVEQYFSDFLSIMESRTPNNNRGEPLLLHSGTMAQATGGTQIPPILHIPANVYFTGTVNVDESTYMFSPKVLDRANVIEFNEVSMESYLKAHNQEERFVLDQPDVRKSLLKEDESPFCSRTDCIKASRIVENWPDILQEILDILYAYNFHFGYRIVNEVSRFIVNSEAMIKAFDADDALDIQILQKILPKFHGSQARLDEPLTKLFAFCYRDGGPIVGELPGARSIEKAIQDGEFRFPRSARKLSRMLRNLQIQGYTSFIE